MSIKKYLLSAICIGLFGSLSIVRADDISDMKTLLTDTIAKLVQKYETRIQELQTENDALKKEITALKWTAAKTGITPVSPTIVPSITATTSKSDIYAAVMKRANANLGTILLENHLPGYSAIGLFEFIEPNSFFISLDDGNNPAGVTAFKTKILFNFDNNLTFTKVGLFDLDYASQKYRTVFGTNPHINSIRVRMANPSYKGKLLDTTNTGNTGNTETKAPTASSAVPVPAAGEVTVAQIKSAYDKTKLLDALKLSDIYIVKNPDDIEVLRIRYRSYYIVGKYENSLAEIKKIETIQGTAFERTIACDAAVIGKIAKKTDTSNYYSAICKNK